MIEVFKSMGTWSWPIWLVFGFFIFLVVLKYCFLGWVTKRAAPKPLENWDTSASDVKGPRIVGADTQRVLHRSGWDVVKVLFAIVFFAGCLAGIVLLGAEDLKAGQFKAWLGLICGVLFVLASPFLLWIVLTKYRFDDAKLVRVRPMGLFKVTKDWSQIAEVLPLQKGSMTAGVKIVFSDKTVFRIPANLIGYRDFLGQLAKENKSAAAMFVMSNLTKRAIDTRQNKK